MQANPLSKPTPSSGAASGRGVSSGQDEETFTPFSSAGSSSRGILFAAAPLIVPMKLRLSHVRLRAIIVLVVSKTKGITLVFKNDPLESVQVSSTFDSVAVIAKYLQQEIEGQLKEVFREDLPGIIHRLSQKWLSGQTKRKTGAGPEQEAGKAARSSASTHGGEEDRLPAAQSLTTPKRTRKRSENARKASSAAGEASSPPSTLKQRRGSRAGSSKAVQPPPPSSSSSSSAVPVANKPPTRARVQDEEGSFEIPPPLSTSFDDTESYDPTYGLRPDEVRLPKDGKGFKGLKGLKKGGGALGGRTSMGLGGLLDDIQSSQQDGFDAADIVDAEDQLLEEAEAEERRLDGGESEWAEEDGLDRMGALDEALYDEQDDRHLPQALSRRAGADPLESAAQQEREDDVDSDSSLSSLEDDHSPESASHLLDDIDRPDFDPFNDVVAHDGVKSTTYSDLPSGSRAAASATNSRNNGRMQRESTPLTSSSPHAKRQSLATIEALRGGAFRSSGSTPSLGSFGTGSGSRRVGAGVGLSGSDAGYGYMPLSASMRAASVLNAAGRVYGNKAASTSGRTSMPTSASLSNLASARSSMLSRSPSSGLQPLSESRSRPPSIRPRIFHSSSLIRPVDPSVYGGDTGDASVDEGSLYPVSNWTGSVRGGRSESVGGGSTTIYGGGGGGADSSRSGPGSSRTFTISKKRNGTSGASTARSAGSATGSGGGGTSTVMEEGNASGRMPARQTLTRASSTLSNLLGQRGWDWGAQGSHEEDFFSQEERLHDNLPTSSSTSSLDEPGSSSRSHSHSNSFSGSGSRAGTLSTLEPEPMDETSVAYKRQLEKEKLGGLVRVGWDGVDANETTSGQRSAGGRGTTGKSSSVPPRRSGVSGTVTPLGFSTGRPAAGIPPSTSHPRYLHLQDLVASNQTLSPYTRLSDTRGWAVRSTPGTPGAGSSTEGSLLGQVRDGWTEAVQDVEARRRRTFNLGGRAGGT